MTDRSDGDVATAALTQGASTPTWSWLRQVHGDRVVTVEAAGDQVGASGDALVTQQTDATLTIRVADCVPVAFVAANGAVGAAHAGWRGLFQGVLESTHRALRLLQPRGPVTAVVGPSICASCYEFGEPELTQLAERFGADIRATTAEGTPAADLKVAVGAELERLAVEPVYWSDVCTSCDAGRHWSYRARGEMQRQAMLVTITA